MDPPITAIVADDVTISRDLLCATLEDAMVHVVGQTTTGAELARLCQSEEPDVVVTDVDLGDGPVERWLPTIARSGARVVVFSQDPSPDRLTALLTEHVAGYLLHDIAPERLVDAVHDVAAGGAALDAVAATTLLSAWRRLRNEPAASNDRRTTLTPREQDVLAAMADGLATKAIAVRLGVAHKTVENHKVRVFDKLGVRTQAQAVSVAIAHGLVTPPMAAEGVLDRSELSNTPSR